MIEINNQHIKDEWSVITPYIFEGEYTKVYKAKKLNKLICNKLIDDEFIIIKEIQLNNYNKIFYLEIEVLELLNKNNENIPVVKYYGYGEDENNKYIYMEFLKGDSIFKINQKKLKFYNEYQIYKILLKLFKNLEYLYNNDYVYMDLKSDNIMIDVVECDGGASEDIEFNNLKLIDFGLCRKKGSKLNQIIGTHNPTTTVHGTIINESFDTWGIGCLIIELLVGTVTGDPEIPMTTSPLCRNFIQTCLIKEINSRLPFNIIKNHPFILMYQCKSTNEFNDMISNYYKNIMLKLPFEMFKKEFKIIDSSISVISDNQEIKFDNIDILGLIIENYNYQKCINELPGKLKYLSIGTSLNNNIIMPFSFNILPRSLVTLIYYGKFEEPIQCYYGDNIKNLLLCNYNFKIGSTSIPKKTNFLHLGNDLNIEVIQSLTNLPPSIHTLCFGCNENLLSDIKRDHIPSTISFLYINNILKKFDNSNLINYFNNDIFIK